MRKAFVFDFDDTLATTKAKVVVLNGMGYFYKELTPSEYNTFELPEGCKFDFSQFQCEETIKKAMPTFLLSLAKEIHDEQHNVYILTARNLAAADAIRQFLLSHDINPTMVFCVGQDGDTNIPEEKRKVLLTIMEGYDKIYFYDDSQENIDNTPDSTKLRKYKI